MSKNPFEMDLEEQAAELRKAAAKYKQMARLEKDAAKRAGLLKRAEDYFEAAYDLEYEANN